MSRLDTRVITTIDLGDEVEVEVYDEPDWSGAAPGTADGVVILDAPAYEPVERVRGGLRLHASPTLLDPHTVSAGDVHRIAMQLAMEHGHPEPASYAHAAQRAHADALEGRW